MTKFSKHQYRETKTFLSDSGAEIIPGKSYEDPCLKTTCFRIGDAIWVKTNSKIEYPHDDYSLTLEVVES